VHPDITESHFELANDVSIFYKLSGTGNIKIVMINGSGATERMWDPWIERFILNGEAEGKYQILTYDHRGSGKSKAPLITQTSTSLAIDCMKLMNHVGWKEEKIHVLGASMGGLIAQELAWILIHRKRLASLFFSVTARRFTPFQLPFGHSFYKHTLVNFVTKKPKDEIIRFVIDLCFDERYLNSKHSDNVQKVEGDEGEVDSRTEREILIEGMHKNWNTHMSWNVNTLAAQYPASFSHLFHLKRCEILKKQNIPIAIQISKRDKVVAPERQYELAKLLNAKILDLDCGHLADPSFFDQIVNAFTENVNRGVDLLENNNNNRNNNNNQ
jgi:pimeloyl-ACP methyl ester carboxylesterase